MELDWSDEQHELYERAVEFASSVGEGNADETWNGSKFPSSGWRRCAEFGLTGLSVPSELGGLGLGALMTARLVEGFGRGLADSGLLFAVNAHLFAVAMPIAEHGSPALRSEIVPRLSSGRAVGANAITEPGAGSDSTRLATRAVRDGDHYVLSGEKCFVTNAPAADHFLVYATTNASAGYLGQSAFVVDRETPGLQVGAPYTKIGLPHAPLASVFMDGCRVPRARLVGLEGQGTRIFARSMAWERACLFSAFVGAMEGSLVRCVEYAQLREQGGGSIARHQAVSHRLAEMKRRLESARWLVYYACWKHDRGEDATLEISLAKLAVSEAAVESGIDAIRVHGGLGYMQESGVARELLDGLGSTIFSGTSDIQRELIAHRLAMDVARGGSAAVRAGARSVAAAHPRGHRSGWPGRPGASDPGGVARHTTDLREEVP